MTANAGYFSALRAVSAALGPLRTEVVFVGGMIRSLLITNPLRRWLVRRTTSTWSQRSPQEPNTTCLRKGFVNLAFVKTGAIRLLFAGGLFAALPST